MWCIFVLKIVALSTSNATQYNLERFAQEQIIFCWYLESGYTIFWFEIWCLYMSLSRFLPGSTFSWFCWTVSDVCDLLLRSLWNVSHLSTSDKCPLVCFGSELFSFFFCGQVTDCIAILVLFTMFFATFHIVLAIVESIDARKHIICQIFYGIVGIFFLSVVHQNLLCLTRQHKMVMFSTHLIFIIFIYTCRRQQKILEYFGLNTAKKRLCLSFGNPILRTAVSKTCCLALLYCYISYDKTVF